MKGRSEDRANGKIALILFFCFAIVVSGASCGISRQEARVDTLSGYEAVSADKATGGVIPRDEELSDAEESLETGASLPEDFPIPVPDDYRVIAAGDSGGETAAVLDVPSGKEAYLYYREVLPDEGLTVVDGGRNSSSYFHAELAISARNFEGNLEFHDDRVEMDVDYYQPPPDQPSF